MPTHSQNVIQRLKDARPLVTVELRPPRAGMSYEKSMDVWIDMFHSVQRLARRDTLVFLTDQAVGQAEEENLGHLTANLGDDVDRSKIVPFLTTKHSLDYCRMYAKRAASFGFEALTVLGGDKHVGPQRCVEHAFELRRVIKQDMPGMTLGGWANPHANPEKQVDYLLEKEFSGDFFLTQIVSHHDLEVVGRFVNECTKRGVRVPGIFGVFLYRSGNPKTLETLKEFFPVPVDGIKEEFAAGATPEEICIRSIKALFRLGITRVYVSNLGYKRVDALYKRIVSELGVGAVR